MTVSITRKDVTPAELRREAGRTSEAAAARRMLAIALVIEGHSRVEAARQCGMDRQTLRDWVHRFNEEGMTGRGCRIGRTRAVYNPVFPAERQARVAEWVRTGLDQKRLARTRPPSCKREFSRPTRRLESASLTGPSLSCYAEPNR